MKKISDFFTINSNIIWLDNLNYFFNLIYFEAKLDWKYKSLNSQFQTHWVLVCVLSIFNLSLSFWMGPCPSPSLPPITHFLFPSFQCFSHHESTSTLFTIHTCYFNISFSWIQRITVTHTLQSFWTIYLYISFHDMMPSLLLQYVIVVWFFRTSITVQKTGEYIIYIYSMRWGIIYLHNLYN